MNKSDHSEQGGAAAVSCPSASKHSIGFTHPKAAALHQIIKPEPAQQISSGLHGDDAQCSLHGAGGPKTFLKKKWMADHMESIKKEEVAQQSSDSKGPQCVSPRQGMITVRQGSELQQPPEPTESSIKRSASIISTAAVAVAAAVTDFPAAAVVATVKKERLPPRPKLNDDFEDSLFTPLVAAPSQPPPAGPATGTTKPRQLGESVARPAKDLPKGSSNPNDAKQRATGGEKSRMDRIHTHSSFTQSTEGATSPRAVPMAEAAKGRGGKREGQASNMDAEAHAGDPPCKASPGKAKAKDGHSTEKLRPKSDKGDLKVMDKASPLSVSGKTDVQGDGKKAAGAGAAFVGDTADVNTGKGSSRPKRPALVESGEAATPVVSGDRDGGSGFSGQRDPRTGGGGSGVHKRAKVGTPPEEGATGAGAAASAATLGFTGGDMRGTESEAGVAPAGPRRREGQAVVECIVEARQGESRVTRDVDLGSLNSFKDLWSHLGTVVPAMPDRLDSKMAYLDSEGDWLLITPDEHWTTFACCATKLLVCTRS